MTDLNSVPKATAKRTGRDNPEPGGPRHGPAYKSARPTPQTLFAVCDGTDRLGAFRIDGMTTFTAFDRLGFLIGTFASQNEATVAIEQRAAS
jgi:hypothetical protein